MEKNQHKSSGLSSGFLLGIIVGVVITLLLTTKRGKRILKLVTEEGMQKFSNWEDLINDFVDDYETKPSEPKLSPVALTEEEQQRSEEMRIEGTDEEEQKEKKEGGKPLKRFFKNIHRRSIN